MISRSLNERRPIKNLSAHRISLLEFSTTKSKLSSRSKQPTSSETSEDDDKKISVTFEFVSFANDRTIVCFPDSAFPTKRHGQPIAIQRATASIGSKSCTGNDKSKSSISYIDEFVNSFRGTHTSPTLISLPETKIVGGSTSFKTPSNTSS